MNTDKNKYPKRGVYIGPKEEQQLCVSYGMTGEVIPSKAHHLFEFTADGIEDGSHFLIHRKQFWLDSIGYSNL